MLGMARDVRSWLLPYRTVAVGSVVRVGGSEYDVVLRPAGLPPREACRGCSFRMGTCPPPLACSGFDRYDGNFVWFVKRDEVKQER